MRSRRELRRPMRLVFGGIVAGLLGWSAAIGGNPNPRITPPNKQYEELSARWWQWALSQPVAMNPLFDTTGVDAKNGQPTTGNVFFLAGLIAANGDPLNAVAKRTITIPTGTRLFFPILNSEFDNFAVDGQGNPAPTTFSEVELREFAALLVDNLVEMHASIDGVPVEDLASYRTRSPLFQFTLPDDNIDQFFGLDVVGDSPPPGAVADGFYLLVNPLNAGDHTINFGGTTQSVDPITGETSFFHLDITYHIKVTSGKK